MKILHIWNTAAVPQTIAKFQEKLGHKADVITRSNRFAEDVYDNVIVINGKARRYALSILARAWKYDIIHSHSNKFTFKYISPFYRKKKFVFHFHGTDIRGQWNTPLIRNIVKKAHKIVVSTPELLEGSTDTNAIWLPNPVDTTHFIRTHPYAKNTGLFILRWKRQEPALRKVVDLCHQEDIKLTILNRETEEIDHKDFPTYLQQFEYYFDTKIFEAYGTAEKNKEWDVPHSELKLNYSLSMTALQQLSMGGKVYNGKNIITTFPSEYEPNLIAKRTINIYQELLA